MLSGFADRTARARAWRDHGELDERRARYEGPLMRWTRHTAIRNMTNAGVPLQRVMQVTGHLHVPTHLAYNVPAESDLEMVRRLYDGAKKKARKA